MRPPLLLALRFARGWASPPKALQEREVRFSPLAGGESVHGTLIEPPGDTPLPGWVVLHGITRKGREHPALRRFVRALAGTGARVLVPGIEEWTALDFAPERAQSILQGAILTLAEHPGVEPGGVLLAGFSFGGPQALHAAASTPAGPRVRGVLVWGGYADLHRTLHFQFTGEHGLDPDGSPRHREQPDPYGRWVVGSNCMGMLPGRGDTTPVSSALWELAALAGDRGVDARSPELDPVKVRLREGLAPGLRELFDLFAPAAGRMPEREGALALVRDLGQAARNAFPLLDPIPRLGPLPAPVRLLHGRDDCLIPFTETEELARRLADRVPDLGTGITGLFAHSSGGESLPPWSRAREGLHFLRVLRRAFQVV